MSANIGLINKSTIQDIADAIKTQSGSNASMTMAQMSTNILNIETQQLISASDYEQLVTFDNNNFYCVYSN